MGRAVGIDFGTTNSVVVTLEAGRPVVVPNAEGGLSTPSVVAFARDGSVLVGQRARNQAVTNPDRTIRSVKRHLGTDWTTPEIDGRRRRPQEIAAHILHKLVVDAEEHLDEEITDAVITVPAYFEDPQRQAVRDAGRIAGLNVLRIVNEPTAAALAYGLGRSGLLQTVVVFDAGGGTCDLSLLMIEDGVIEVRATSGADRLGGDDWDDRVVSWLVDRLHRRSGVDLAEDEAAMQRVREAAEHAKIELSSATTTAIAIPYIASGPTGPVSLFETLTRSEFERITADLLERTKEPFHDVLRGAGVSVTDIDQVLLVGGSTRMPAVTTLVTELAGGRPPSRRASADEVVAVGAALQAGVLCGEVKDVLLLDVIPFSLGVETQGGVMTTLIERNTTIPTKRSEVFSTASDNRTSFELHVFQGEHRLAADNTLLGVLELPLPPAPAGVPQIEVSFDVDANGIVDVAAKDLGTGRSQAMQVTGASAALGKEDIDRLTREVTGSGRGRGARRRAAAPATGIFVNYRTSDTGGTAGRLAEQLAAQFGDDRVFVDVESIDPGADFRAAVYEAVERSRVMLVVIGDRWSSARDGAGAVRLENPDDLLRLEIEHALRIGVTVAPVLVDGATMPARADLPPSLGRLTTLNALALHNRTWRRDLTDLLAAVTRMLE